MRALVCRSPGDLALETRPDPSPGPEDAVLRIRRVGVCGTDYHIVAGRQPFLSYPRIMGHEIGAEVVHAPAGSGLRAGMKAYVVPYLSCGTCRACRRGLTNCCRRIRVLGVHQDGGMAEYLALPARAVAPVEGVTLDHLAAVEFLAIGAHGVRRAAVSADDRVLVIGAGPIGMAAIIAAIGQDAEVSVLDVRADRLDFARDILGAARTVPIGPDTARALGDATDGEFFDVVIDATGDAGSMQRALGFLGHGGRLVYLGLVTDDLALPDPEFHKRETTLLASRNALPDDFAAVVARLRAGAVPIDALLTHRSDLAGAAALIPVWAKPDAGVRKAMITL